MVLVSMVPVIVATSQQSSDGTNAFLGAVIVGLLVWWYVSYRARKRALRKAKATPSQLAKRPVEPSPTQRPGVRSRSQTDGGTVEWTPPGPPDELVEPWLLSNERLEVVGENYRESAFRKLFSKDPSLSSDSGARMDTFAVLVSDEDNPYGHGRAIAVFVDGLHVGYVANTDTLKWTAIVKGLAQEGRALIVPADVWAAARGSWVYGNVRLQMPETNEIEPMNPMPTGATLLPVGGRRQVTQEDAHLSELVPYLRPGQDTPLVATLHAITEVRPRSVVELVEVRVERVKSRVVV